MNTTVTLRDYQAQAVTRVLQKFDDGTRRICLVSPTGSGKTVKAAAIVQALVRRGLRILFLAHRHELIEQAVRRLGVPVTTIVAGTKRVPRSQVYVASRDTLVRREVPDVDVVVIDEAHHAPAAGYVKILAALPRALVLGLTATPCRLDDRGLGDVFDELVEAAKVSRLIDQGVLVRPVVLSHPHQPDLGGVKATAGDYNAKELEERVNKNELRGDVVQTWLSRANNAPTVVFAVGIAHSKALVADFAAAGVAAVHVDGKMGKQERDDAIARVRDGRARVIVNVGILTEGWDFPELEVCVLARPTQSLSLLLQMWGRVMRTAPGKTRALVLDHAGNCLRHGLLPWNDVHWSLEQTRRKTKRGAVVSIKNCPKCYLVVTSQVRTCPCGYVWPAPALGAVTSTGELAPLSHIDVAQLAQQAVGRAAIYGGVKPSESVKRWLKSIEEKKADDAFCRLVVQCRGSVGKAAYRYKQIFGRWP